MATINVILQAKAQDRGVQKWLMKTTALADGLAASMARASRAIAGIDRGALGSLGIAAGGRARARGGGMAAGGAAGGVESPRQRRPRQDSREVERHIDSIIRSGQQTARADQRRARASEKSARALENLSDEQLKEREIQREINARRVRAARASAKESLGADPTRAKMGTFGRVEFAENLATVSGEFDRVSGRVEQGLRGTFNAFRDYEKKVAEIGTITDAVTLDQIDAIAKAAVSEFGGDPMRQAEALQKVMSMGAATAADAQEQLMQANKLGIAGSANVADSVTAISKAVANFKGTSAQEVADSIFAVTQASSAEVGDLAQALPRIAAGAAAAGLTLQETVGTIGQLSNKLPDANQAVTGMIQMMSNISKPTKAARTEARRLGIDFSVAGIEAAGGWEEFLLKLRSAEGFDENTLAKLFESSEARNAVAALTEDMEGLRKNLAAQETAAGGAEKAYAKMTDTAAHKAALLEGQWETLKIQAGEKLIPMLSSMADAAMPMIGAVSTMINDNPVLISTVAKLAIGLVVGTKALAGITSAMSMWNTITGLADMKSAALGKTLGGTTSKITAASTATSGFARAGLSIPGVFMAAQGALLAFSVVLDDAQRPLRDYEERLGKIEEQQKNISFWRDPTAREKEKFETERAAKIAGLQKQREAAKTDVARQTIDLAIASEEAKTLGPVAKTDREVLMEQRERLVSQVQSSLTEVSQTRLGGVSDDANLFQKAYGGGLGILNEVSGVTEDAEMRLRDAELTLARFDKQNAEALGYGAYAFTTEPASQGFTGEGGTLAMLAQLVEETRKVADNTRTTVGPSMEAGAIS